MNLIQIKVAKVDKNAIVNLMDICRAHRLSTFSLRKDLVDRLSKFIESLAVHDDNVAAKLLEECEA